MVDKQVSVSVQSMQVAVGERRTFGLPLYSSKPSHSVSLCPGFDWTSKTTLSRRGA